MAFARNDFKVTHITEQLTSSEFIKTADVIKELTALGVDLSTATIEVNDAGFSLYSILLPQLLTAIKSTLTLPQPQGIDLSWTIADCVLDIVYGSILINYAVRGLTHTPIATGIEGGMTIASGVQMIVLASISVITNLIAIAVALAITAVFSIYHTIVAARKWLDDDFWFKESLEFLTFSRKMHGDELFAKQEQINEIRNSMEKKKEQVKEEQKKREQEIVDNMIDLNNKAPTDQKLSEGTLNFITDITLRFVKNRLEQSDQDIQDLQTEIFARLVTDYVKKGKESYLYKNKIDTEQFTPSQQFCLNFIKNDIEVYNTLPTQTEQDRAKSVDTILKEECKLSTTKNVKKGIYISYVACEQATQESRAKCKKDTIVKFIDALYMNAASIGMFLASIPGLEFLAPFFIGPAVGYFAAKYSVQITSFASSVHSFFSQSNKTEETEQLEQQQEDKAKVDGNLRLAAS